MRALRIAARGISTAAFLAYSATSLALQTPRVWRARNPRFISDEVCSQNSGEDYAVVVKYAPIGVTHDFLELLKVLKKVGVNAIVVCNGPLDPDDYAPLQKTAHRIIIRENIGRDFGAYRAATLGLIESGIRIRRLLYFNDSIIYIPGPQLQDMVEQMLTSPYDVIGAFENHEYVHHIGSFAFALSGRVFRDARVRKFWRNYKCYDLRPYAIQHGEAGLSEALSRSGFRMDVIYSADRLAEHLGRLPLRSLLDVLRYVPFGALRSYDLEPILSAPAGTAALVESQRTQVIAHPGDTAADGQLPARVPHEQSPAPQMLHDVLLNRIMESIVNSSQVHFGFGLFHRLMGCPLIKRDLLFRGIMLEHECARVLDDMQPEQRHFIMRELINRGRPAHTSLLRQFKMRHGLI
jgi:hypothetical protein